MEPTGTTETADASDIGNGQSLKRWAAGWPGTPLREDVQVFPGADGGIELFDPVRDKVVSLTSWEVQLIRSGVDPDDRLQLEGWVEDARAATMRTEAWRLKRGGGRAVTAFQPALAGLMPQPVEGGAFGFDGLIEPFAVAPLLPSGVVAEAWRSPERWRRLAVAHRGGTRYLAMPGFLTPEAAAELAAHARALPHVVLKTPLVTARRCLVDASLHTSLRPWLQLMASAPLCLLVGAVLGRPIPSGLVVNAWRLHQHDFMGVHPDGRFYRGTFSLGLSTGWEAADGGAIAFGTPTDDGFRVAERWYPHLGDALLFAPDGDTWHAVEPVRTPKIRWSLTGWWVEPEHALSNKDMA